MKYVVAILLLVIAGGLLRERARFAAWQSERLQLTQEIDRQYRFRTIAEAKLAQLRK